MSSHYIVNFRYFSVNYDLIFQVRHFLVVIFRHHALIFVILMSFSLLVWF